MTVRELIKYLEGCDEDSEVRMVCQPNWPFEYTIEGTASKSDFLSYDELNNLEEDIVYIIEGDQLGYAKFEFWK